MSEANPTNADDELDDPRDRFLEHYRRPRNRRVLANPDAVGFVESPGGATLTVYLRLGRSNAAELQIQEMTFQSRRCGIAVAYASLLTELVPGLPLARARDLRPEDLMSRFGKGAGALESAALAIDALRHALDNYMQGPRHKADHHQGDRPISP